MTLSSPSCVFLPSVLSSVVLFSRGPLWCFGSHSIFIHSHTFKCGFSPQPDFVILIPALHLIPALTMHCIVNFLLFLSPWNPGSPIAPQTLISNSLSTPVPCLGSHKNIQIHPPKTKPQLERLSLQLPPEAGTCYPGHCVFPFSFHHSPPFVQAAPGLSLQTSLSSFCT